MGVKLWINKNHVYLSLCFDKKIRRESTGLTLTGNVRHDNEIMKMAETLRVKREIQMVALRNGMADPELSKLTLYEYVEKYSDERGREKQIYKCLTYLKNFGGQIKITAVTPIWYENFQNRMQKDSGLAANTQEKYCNVIRQVLKKAVRDCLLAADPSNGIRHIYTTEGKKEFLTADEVRALVVTDCPGIIGDEIKKAFLFGVCTGLRISDILGLTWGNIDIPLMQIQKQQKKTKEWVYIPLKKEAWSIINDGSIHDAQDVLFATLAVTKSNTNKNLKKWAEIAGIKKNVTWHTARHTDATMLIESGADLYTVQKLLGHSKIQTTAKYAKVTDKLKKEAVEALPDYGIVGN